MLEREGVALPRSEPEPESADPQVHWKGRVDGQPSGHTQVQQQQIPQRQDPVHIKNNNMASLNKKVPTIPPDYTYGKFGTWKLDFGAYLSRNEMCAWSSLNEKKMPDNYPTLPADPAAMKVDENYLKFKHKYDIEDKYSFEANSEKAWGCLYEATRAVPALNRIITLNGIDKSFKPAYLALEEYIRGHAKTASRNMRRELLDAVRAVKRVHDIMPLVTLAEKANADIMALGCDDELTDDDLKEEILDVLRNIPETTHVYQLARMPKSEIGDWPSLRLYLTQICANHDKPTKSDRDNDKNTALPGDRPPRPNPRNKPNPRGKRPVPPDVKCWRCGGNHYSTSLQWQEGLRQGRHR